MERNPAKADQNMANYLCALGRRHFSYGSNPPEMELLAMVMVDALMSAYELNGDNDEENVIAGDSADVDVQSKDKYNRMYDALLAFFKVIAYWLQNGFNYVQNRGMD